MSDLQIRSLSDKDKTAWLPLWRAYLDFYEKDLPAEQNEKVWSRLMDTTDPLQGLVGLSNGQIVSFSHFYFHQSTWTENGYCYLEDLFVDQSIRAKGLGRALIDEIKERSSEAGLTKVYWITDRDNERAQRLYDKIAIKVDDFIQYEMKL